ncbi:MAG: hypothetical protein OEU46_19705 [Alphaproteobacteria bacterium]|nr:hypothetical protein [Alphaproteobacteria bacterium]
MRNVDWKSFELAPIEGGWEPAGYNIIGADGREYGRWRRVLREHSHGLTVISRYRAPPGKAWKIIGKASELGEEVYILEGGYYDAAGRVIAGPGMYRFNAPGAVHGGISRDLTLYIHCCSGEPDEIVSIDLIDFEPVEQVSLALSPASYSRGNSSNRPGEEI